MQWKTFYEFNRNQLQTALLDLSMYSVHKHSAYWAGPNSSTAKSNS